MYISDAKFEEQLQYFQRYSLLFFTILVAQLMNDVITFLIWIVQKHQYSKNHKNWFSKKENAIFLYF